MSRVLIDNSHFKNVDGRQSRNSRSGQPPARPLNHLLLPIGLVIIATRGGYPGTGRSNVEYYFADPTGPVHELDRVFFSSTWFLATAWDLYARGR